MNQSPISFGILGSGNMARVYGDALATQTPGGRLTAIALGTRTPALAAEFGVAAESSAEALVARLVKDLKAHIGSADQFDDITLLAVRRAPTA